MLEQRREREKAVKEKHHIDGQMRDMQQLIQHKMREREYEEIKQKSEARNTLQKTYERIAQEISTWFSHIEPALKKYERVTLEPDVITAYLQDPVHALQDDEQLKIAEMLVKLSIQVRDQKLELKDKKRERIASQLEQFDVERLRTQRLKLIETLRKMSEIEEWIASQEATTLVNELRNTLSQLEARERELQAKTARWDEKKEQRQLAALFDEIVMVASQCLASTIRLKREGF